MACSVPGRRHVPPLLQGDDGLEDDLGPVRAAHLERRAELVPAGLPHVPEPRAQQLQALRVGEDVAVPQPEVPAPALRVDLVPVPEHRLDAREGVQLQLRRLPALRRPRAALDGRQWQEVVPENRRRGAGHGAGGPLRPVGGVALDAVVGRAPARRELQAVELGGDLEQRPAVAGVRVVADRVLGHDVAHLERGAAAVGGLVSLGQGRLRRKRLRILPERAERHTAEGACLELAPVCLR
mmetsp:Transcript_109358/g.309360  ORF Transcript_109358/g.309360 Transcript_109358/m.309360 type:complete len:239 (+) Transcript_109358:520-1236(+)